MHKLTDYRRPITRVEFSPGGDLLVGMGQKNLWCWTRSRGWELTGLQHPTGFAAFAFHPAGLTIAYSGLPPPSLSRTDAARPTDIRFHALNSSGTFAPDCIAVPAVPGALAHTVPFTTSLTFTPDGTMLLAKLLPVPAYAHRRAASWPLAWDGAAWRSGSPTLEWDDGLPGARRVGERSLAFLGMWGVRTCLLDDDRPILRTPPLAECSPVAVAPTGELVAGVAGNELRVWNLRVQAPVAVHALNGRILDVLAFSPDARTLAVAWRDRAVQLCDPLRGFGESFDFGTGRAESMAFAPDGLTLAVAGVNGLVVVDVG